MTRSPSGDDDNLADLADLLNTDRELSDTERSRLLQLSATIWGDVTTLAAHQARAAYQVANAEQFTECVRHHMDGPQTLVLLNAEVYHCPRCGQLLKDRRTPVASSILLERSRLAALLTEAEDAPPGPERKRLWHRFRAALGLSS